MCRCVCVSKPMSEGAGVACALLTMPTLTCTRFPKINGKIHNREDSLAVALELLARFEGNQRFERNENAPGPLSPTPRLPLFPAIGAAGV